MIAGAQPGWDPSKLAGRSTNYLVTVRNEDGSIMMQTTDVNKPPKGMGCDHQRAGDISCRDCPDSLSPSGFNMPLYHDKGGARKMNRILHIPLHIWNELILFISIRDEYFSIVKPMDDEGKANWWKGVTPIFLNSTGKSNKTFFMKIATEVTGENVSPQLFRRFFCTYFAHDENREVREAESQVAGHSEKVFRKFYDENVRKSSMSLQMMESEQERFKLFEEEMEDIEEP